VPLRGLVTSKKKCESTLEFSLLFSAKQIAQTTKNHDCPKTTHRKPKKRPKTTHEHGFVSQKNKGSQVSRFFVLITSVIVKKQTDFVTKDASVKTPERPRY